MGVHVDAEEAVVCTAAPHVDSGSQDDDSDGYLLRTTVIKLERTDYRPQVSDPYYMRAVYGSHPDSIRRIDKYQAGVIRHA